MRPTMPIWLAVEPSKVLPENIVYAGHGKALLKRYPACRIESLILFPPFHSLKLQEERIRSMGEHTAWFHQNITESDSKEVEMKLYAYRWDSPPMFCETSGESNSLTRPKISCKCAHWHHIRSGCERRVSSHWSGHCQPRAVLQSGKIPTFNVSDWPKVQKS